MSVYIYCRQSSGSSEQSISIDQQEENCKSLAEKNKLTVSKVFADYNCSGRIFPTQLASLAEMDSVYKQFMRETKKTGWRNELSKLLDELKKGDTIIVDDKTRLVRSLNGSYLENGLIQLLKEKKIKLFSNKEGEINFDNFTDQLVFSLQSSINSNQLEIQRKKCKDSLKRLKDLGENKQCLGGSLGYKSTGIKGKISIDDTTAPIVKYTFEQYLKGKSLLSMCREINKKWGRKVVVKSLKNILQRVEYTGFMYDSNHNLIKCKQTEGIELVDFRTYQLANNLLNSRKGAKFQIKKYPSHFTSMLHCGICGSVLKICINNHGKYFSFRCMQHVLRAQENCKVSITANTLYTTGLSLEDAIYPILIIGLFKKLQVNPNKDKQTLIEKQVELVNLQNKEIKFTDIFLQGLLSNSVYETNLKQLKEKKDILQQEIIQLEQSLAEDNSDHIRHLVNKIVARKLTFEEYHELLPYSIKDIVVYPTKVVVKTVEGDVELERYKDRGILKLREYIWSNMPNKYKIIYYKKAPNIYLPKKTIFTSTNLTIQQLED